MCLFVNKVVAFYSPLFHFESTSPKSFKPSCFVNLSRNANGVLIDKTSDLIPLLR